MAGRGEAIEVEQGTAVHDGATDLDDAAETNQVLVVDLILAQQFGVITEIAQEPVKLPQRFRRAVEASQEGVAGQGFRFKHGELKVVVRPLCVPAIACALDQEQDIGKNAGRGRIGLVQAFDLAFHAAPAFAPR